ncbi:MAG TPA: MFS transporter [Nocardioidaceae bacterium]|nr:MFS transporter [Nocardioidaceae bacterium]
MTYLIDESAARRRFVTVSALFWLPLGLTIAPLILLFTERGMSLAAIAGFVAAHSITVAILELPTGGLSDVVGRRVVLVVAGALNLAALLLQGLGTTAWELTLAMALMGAARALSTGPAEAWYVDTVHEHSGRDAELRTGLARGETATSAALAIGTLLGGALPWLLAQFPDVVTSLNEATAGRVLPLSVPSLLGAVLEIAFIGYVLTALHEPARPSTTMSQALRDIPATVVGGLRLGGRDALIRRVLLSAGAAGSALAIVELLTPGRAADLTGAAASGAVLFAVLACAGFVTSALGSHLAPLLARLARSGERAIVVALGISTAGLLLLGATVTSDGALAMVAAATGYGLVYLGLGAAGPSENDLLHQRVDSSGRATALSVQSLVLQIVGALAGVTAAVLPAGPLPWLLAAVVLVAAALGWASRPAGPSRRQVPAATDVVHPAQRT